jgi:hypothetical protein
MTDNTGAAAGAKAREAKPPYTATGDIDLLFERMAGLKAPPKVDGAWAKNYKLAEESVSALKWLGVAAADGTVDGELWAKLRVPASRQTTLADLVAKSYTAILDQIDADKASKDDIHGAFVAKYGMADTARYIRAFVKLCALAGIKIGGLAEPENGSGEKPERKPKKTPATRATGTVTPPVRERSARTKPDSGKAAAVGVSINVNVEIPATWTEDEIRDRMAAVRRAVSEGDE